MTSKGTTHHTKTGRPDRGSLITPTYRVQRNKVPPVHTATLVPNQVVPCRRPPAARNMERRCHRREDLPLRSLPIYHIYAYIEGWDGGYDGIGGKLEINWSHIRSNLSPIPSQTHIHYSPHACLSTEVIHQPILSIYVIENTSQYEPYIKIKYPNPSTPSPLQK